MQDNDFNATGCMVQTSEDGAEVRLGFYDDDDRQNGVVIRRGSIPALLSLLHRKIGEGTVRPISAAGADIGTVFRLVGTEIRPLPKGGARLVLYIEVEDGGRTIPIDLPPDDLKTMIQDLSQHL